VFVFKACSRCSGDLYAERDLGQTDLVCLQCGFRKGMRAWIDEAPEARIQELRRKELGETGVLEAALKPWLAPPQAGRPLLRRAGCSSCETLFRPARSG
jgi:hypothetical protein